MSNLTNNFINPKPCSKCGHQKLVSEFNTSNNKISRYCKLCTQRAAKENYNNNREKKIAAAKLNQLNKRNLLKKIACQNVKTALQSQNV